MLAMLRDAMLWCGRASSPSWSVSFHHSARTDCSATCNHA